MLSALKTFFAIHLFESKSYEDSAGRLEVREPMVQSGLLGEHQTYAFGWQEKDSIELIKHSVSQCFEHIEKQPLVIYGAGAHTTQYWPYFNQLNIVAIADKNTALWGQILKGVPVISPAKIKHYSSNVLISSRAYEENIATELDQQKQNLVIFKLYDKQYMASALETWCHELASRVKSFQPELLVHTPTHINENIPKSFFLGLKAQLPKLKVITIWWDYDEKNEAAGYLNYERDVLEYADLVIENSNASRLERMHRRQAPYERHQHVERVIFHPTWFDPSLFYYDEAIDKNIEIALFGSVVGERQAWIELLRQAFGKRFKHIGGVSGEQKDPIAITEYAALLRQTKIVINTQTYGFRKQCKGKVREAVQCGCILFEQENSETKVFNKLNGPFAIEYFSDPAELIKGIELQLVSHTPIQGVDSVKLAKTWTETILIKLA